MIGFAEASKRFFTRAFDFKGRSSASEFWFSLLMLIIVFFLLALVLSALGEIAIIILSILYIGAIIPSLSVGVRRLHDTDRSGWWYLISLIPLASLVLWVFFCMSGTKGPNRFGEDPYGAPPQDAFS
ncbi:MAG: DUF805 domain-containing protein [Hyphomonadaceae bacterium]